jgi:hypothetical protein
MKAARFSRLPSTAKHGRNTAFMQFLSHCMGLALNHDLILLPTLFVAILFRDTTQHLSRAPM